MRIHQLLAGFQPGDAISNYALEIQKIFRSWGHESLIFVLPSGLDRRMEDCSLPLSAHREHSSPENILIYHFGIGSSATDYFKTIPDVKAVIYHNLTPAHFFAVLKPELASVLKQGREELLELARVCDLGLAVSEYNRKELVEAGFRSTFTVPLTLDWTTLDGEFDRSLVKRYRTNREKIVFVGRVVPNKKIEDLLKFFYYFKLLKPEAMLFIVGKSAGYEKYYDYLQTMIVELELTDVVFSGHISQAKLLAYYRMASLFLCLSEHEGFCMPLMECMQLGIPVMAYAAAAVPDTLGGAGVLIREKNYPEIAEMAALLHDDEGFRRKIVEGQYRRLKEFRSISLEEKLREHLTRMMNNPG